MFLSIFCSKHLHFPLHVLKNILPSGSLKGGDQTASQTDQYTSRGDNRGGAGTTNNWKSLSLGVIYSYISIYLI